MSEKTLKLHTSKRKGAIPKIIVEDGLLANSQRFFDYLHKDREANNGEHTLAGYSAMREMAIYAKLESVRAKANAGQRQVADFGLVYESEKQA